MSGKNQSYGRELFNAIRFITGVKFIDAKGPYLPFTHSKNQLLNISQMRYVPYPIQYPIFPVNTQNYDCVGDNPVSETDDGFFNSFAVRGRNVPEEYQPLDDGTAKFRIPKSCAEFLLRENDITETSPNVVHEDTHMKNISDASFPTISDESTDRKHHQQTIPQSQRKSPMKQIVGTAVFINIPSRSKLHIVRPCHN